MNIEIWLDRGKWRQDNLLRMQLDPSKKSPLFLAPGHQPIRALPFKSFSPCASTRYASKFRIFVLSTPCLQTTSRLMNTSRLGRPAITLRSGGARQRHAPRSSQSCFRCLFLGKQYAKHQRNSKKSKKNYHRYSWPTKMASLEK